jgi:DNA-binding transcriptional MerR regulator
MLAPTTEVARTKSAEAFRTISEVSAELDVPQHVLRFWESRFVQIRPVKRAGGRRYYRPEDVDLLRGIRVLLYAEGITIRGVQKILRERGLRHVSQLGRASCGVTLDEPLLQDKRTPLGADANYAADPHDIFDTGETVPAVKIKLAGGHREKLERILAELLHLKARLRAVRKT